jgi:hypothetical protein
MDLDGWHPDPYGTHHERFFKQGEPTPLVRDGGVGSYDEPPASLTPATAAPTTTIHIPASAVGPPPSRPPLAHRPLTKNWRFWVTAFVLVTIIIAVVVVVNRRAANTVSDQPTAFCVKAPHNRPCTDSFLRSQKRLLHDFWEAYLTDSACYPQHCPGTQAELLLGAASTAKKWLPEVQGSRATTPAAKALNNEIALVLAAANTEQENSGGEAATTPTTRPTQTTTTT